MFFLCHRDFILVNGKIWPKMAVMRRHYRLRLLNGCDSRFLIIRFCQADIEDPTEFPGGPGSPACTEDDAIPFYVIGSDYGLRSDGLVEAPDYKTLVIEPAARSDILINFGMESLSSKRVIMANLGPDSPLGSDYDDPPVKVDTYLFTDRIMAFDVQESVYNGDYFNSADFNDALTKYNKVHPRSIPEPDAPTRNVGLFEGLDAYGRLQPMLGTVYPATDASGAAINWPNKEPYIEYGLAGQQIQGTMGWHEQVTEYPVNGTTEYWDIWNLSVDAHAVHLHLVSFEVVTRFEIIWNGNETARICKDGDWIPNDDDPNKENYPDCDVGGGTYLVTQPNAQHDGTINPWGGRRVVNPTTAATVTAASEYFENSRRDVVTAFPNQVTRIKATFDKVGRYEWHCHVLSHEDHEMMRVYQIVAELESSTPHHGEDHNT
jgi:FtsP/CotA-like multicopper oxidase with cupredoxin domain